MKKKLIVILGVTLMVALVGCGTSSTTGSPTKVDNAASSTSESNKPQTFKIGDTIQLKDYKVTVNGVRTATQDKNGILKAEDGKEYFLVDCTVENTSDKDQVVSSAMMFKVVDKDGQSYNIAIFPDANGQLDGTIGPTRKIKGEYCVQVPLNKTGLELEFNSSFISGQQAIIELN